MRVIVQFKRRNTQFFYVADNTPQIKCIFGKYIAQNFAYGNIRTFVCVAKKKLKCALER